jgi:molybdate transport system substrate-binding protein
VIRARAVPRRLPLSALAGAVLLSACAVGPAAAPEPRTSDQATVRVAAAADLKFALDEVVEIAESRRPGLDLVVVYGSSGTFLQQVRNGAPYDLYLSADLAYPRELVDDGLAAEGDLFRYAVGRLVLWVPDGSAVDPADGLEVLARSEVRRVAIANPEHAPYGVAASSALEATGVADRVGDKLVLGENVAQAAEFVRSGNADAGIVALSLVLSDPLRDVGAWAEVPAELYPRLDQGGVVLARSEEKGAARFARDVLLGEEGSAVLAEYGFSLPERG